MEIMIWMSILLRKSTHEVEDSSSTDIQRFVGAENDNENPKSSQGNEPRVLT